MFEFASGCGTITGPLAGKQCVMEGSLHVSFRETVDMEVDGLPQESWQLDRPSLSTAWVVRVAS